MTNENDDVDTNFDMSIAKKQVERMDQSQFEELATIVNERAGKQAGPQLGRMDNGKFRQFVRENFGIDPGV